MITAVFLLDNGWVIWISMLWRFNKIQKPMLFLIIH